jgi:hypothetical protein
MLRATPPYRATAARYAVGLLLICLLMLLIYIMLL